jgi:hypothetical protein
MTTEQINTIDFKKLSEDILKRWYESKSRDITFAQVIERELKKALSENL